MENDFFVDVKGYEGLYKVSIRGKVFSINSNKFLSPVILNKNKKTSMSSAVNLSNGYVFKTKTIKKIVIESFLNIRGKFMIDHKNGDIEDCSLKNLVISINTKKREISRNKKILDKETNKVYSSIRDLSKEYKDISEQNLRFKLLNDIIFINRYYIID